MSELEKLGYEETRNSKHIKSYSKKLNGRYKHITFCNAEPCKYITLIEDDRNNPTLDLEELQAINEKFKELGWLDKER